MNVIAKLLYIVVLIFPISALALFSDCQNLFPNQQPPTTPTAGRDLCFDDFAIYYSPIEKKPIYAVEKLNREQILARHPKRKNQFYEEARLPFKERALLADYRGSGFDRGHNVPAGDMSNERSMAQSFSLANMMPQARQNNQGIWAKNVEEPTRQYAKRISGDLYVYTGSVGSLGKIGRSGVTVPSYLYKLIYDPEKQKAWAYWVENSDAAQMTPPISYAELMQRTGIDFHLPLENAHTSANSPKIKLPEKEEKGFFPFTAAKDVVTGLIRGGDDSKNFVSI
jgi:endonuclease G